MSVKKLKKKHWLKRLNAVPKKRNLDQNVNDTKCNIWNSFLFFLRILFRAYNFLYSSIRSGGHHQSFFSFRFSSRKSQSQPEIFLTLQVFPKNVFLFRVRKFALHHFLTLKNSILEARWKQMSIYFCISP